MYKIIALIGQSGAGKDRLLRQILKNCPDAHEIVSCTTRPPREGEIEGKNYHFLDGDTFAFQLIKDEFIEATVFNDWAYGTRFRDLDENKINVGVFNPAGINILIDNPKIDLTVYYVKASDKQRLLRQLNREENPNVAEIIRRYETDQSDFLDLDFDYEILVNETYEDLPRAIERVVKDNFK